MALILSLETATSVCSVALHDKGSLVALLELHQENVHSQKLMLLVEDIFQKTGLKSSDLAAVSVSSGPGSYTGLRIGVSIAKGLAFAHDIPLIGVETLEALAFQAKHNLVKGEHVVPMMDARRMEVYMAVYNSDFIQEEPIQPKIIETNPFLEYLNRGRVFFLGDGLTKLKEVLNHPNAVFLKNLNSATSVGELAYLNFENKEFVDLAYFEPNYLKDFRVIASKKNPLLL